MIGKYLLLNKKKEPSLCITPVFIEDFQLFNRSACSHNFSQILSKFYTCEFHFLVLKKLLTEKWFFTRVYRTLMFRIWNKFATTVNWTSESAKKVENKSLKLNFSILAKKKNNFPWQMWYTFLPLRMRWMMKMSENY
jgi:hypothetical protein